MGNLILYFLGGHRFDHKLLFLRLPIDISLKIGTLDASVAVIRQKVSRKGNHSGNQFPFLFCVVPFIEETAMVL